MLNAVSAEETKVKSRLHSISSQPDEDPDGYSESDRRIADALDAAMEDEDLKQLKAALPSALKSSNPAIRNRAIDTIAWFEGAAIDELLPFVIDEDREVAENAVNSWVAALKCIEDERVRCSLIAGVMNVLKDREFQDTVVLEMNDCADELSVRALVKLIGGENESAAAAAMEHYKFTTGEEFTTEEAAEKWLQEQREEE